jgi:hypothetical protein
MRVKVCENRGIIVVHLYSDREKDGNKIIIKKLLNQLTASYVLFPSDSCECCYVIITRVSTQLRV